MKIVRSVHSSCFFAFAFLALLLAAPLISAAQAAPSAGKQATDPPVTVTDNGSSWTLDNGIVKATIDKNTGSMPSLIYLDKGRNVQIMSQSGGTWEHNPAGAPVLTNTIDINPATNGGERAEVSIKGISNGTYTMTRSAPGGGTKVNIEIRYSLGRGDSGIYVYSILSHPASYPAMGVGAEDRYITRLSQNFNWITVDKDRNMLECTPADWGSGIVVHAKEQRILTQGVYKNSVEHKYSYSGMQYKTHAYGWSSTKNHIGAWFINPTTEYLSGGPTRIDLDAHYDSNDNPAPIILDYWHSGHYDGTRAEIPAGVEWNKVIGPIFVYVNSLAKPVPTTQAELDTLKATEGNPTVPASWTANANALWHNALAQWKIENAKWPYAWVNGVDYPHLAQRGNVTGQIVLDDPLAPKGTSKLLPNLVVGLTHADETPAEMAAAEKAMQQRMQAMRAEFAARAAANPGAESGAGPYAGRRYGPGAGAAARPGERRGERPGAGAMRGRRGFGSYTPNADAGSWIHNADYYQFFNNGTPDGRFTITKVRPGTYTLRATANGVLGEYDQANITVVAGKTVDLGKLVWKPVRYGKQVWQIGYPDRSADEFFKGDGSNYWLWGWNLRYALLFPHDITYTVGKSNWHKDWFFEEVPHATNLSFVNPAAKDPANQRFGWVRAYTLAEYPQSNQTGPWAIYGRGRQTVWTVKFNMPKQVHGTASLRVALAGVDGLRNGLAVAVNGKSAGAIGDGSNPENPRLIQTNAIRYNTDRGLWQQRTLKFNAAMLKPGMNEMTFTVPAGDLQSGVVWDYLRLELDQNAKFQAATPTKAGR